MDVKIGRRFAGRVKKGTRKIMVTPPPTPPNTTELVNLLTSILEQVKKQVDIKTSKPLEGKAADALAEFNRIVAALQLKPVPQAPTELKATAIAANKVKLEWKDNSQNEDGFNIERCEGPNCTSFAEIAPPQPGSNSVSHEDSAGVVTKTTYRYRIRAVNKSGFSTYSEIKEVTTP